VHYTSMLYVRSCLLLVLKCTVQVYTYIYTYNNVTRGRRGTTKDEREHGNLTTNLLGCSNCMLCAGLFVATLFMYYP